MDADKALYCNGIAVVQMRSMTKRIVLLFLLCALLVTADVRASQCPKDYWIVEEQIVAWAQSLADKVSGQQRYSKLARSVWCVCDLCGVCAVCGVCVIWLSQHPGCLGLPTSFPT